MSRPSADERLKRLLAVVPWVAARDGPLLSDVASRFGCREDELVEDLRLLFLCGLHPYTPDMLIDVDVAEGRVWIRYADYFSRPLRLTPAEGLALLVAGRSLLAAPGADPHDPLARALEKLAVALGVGADDAVDVSLGSAPKDVMATLRESLSGSRQVEIDYYTFGRDRLTTRTVDPAAVFSAAGQWYLTAWCHLVEDERLFRVDRIQRATLLQSRFSPRGSPGELAVYRPDPGDPRVVLDLEPAAGWVVDQYPVEKVEPLDEAGRVRVTLVASEAAWLERLLLRLGRSATVVDGGAGVASAAARRVLGRYGEG